MREPNSNNCGAIPEELMRQLDYEVDGNHRPVFDGARDFLATLAK